MQMTLHFILFKKPTSLTNLFLRKILRIYRNGYYMVLSVGKRYYMAVGLNITKVYATVEPLKIRHLRDRSLSPL